jgi:hypothetical protein
VAKLRLKERLGKGAAASGFTKYGLIREFLGPSGAMQTIQDQVPSRIYGKKRGWGFTLAHFRDSGMPRLGSARSSAVSRKGRLTPSSDHIVGELQQHYLKGMLRVELDVIADDHVARQVLWSKA